ncbi:hypothetical protein SDJN02_16303, partial [Cucurbita argyrosperma subsp. argyrosperma]
NYLIKKRDYFHTIFIPNERSKNKTSTSLKPHFSLQPPLPAITLPPYALLSTLLALSTATTTADC